MSTLATRPVVTPDRTERRPRWSLGGPPVTGEAARKRDARRRSRADTIATWAARLLTLAAVISLVSIPFRHSPVVDIVTDLVGVFNVPADPSIFVVCLGLALAGAIRRRLRVAYMALVLVMFGVLIADVAGFVSLLSGNAAGGGGYWAWRTSTATGSVTLFVGVGVLLAFVSSRRAFPGRLAPGAVRAALIVLLTGLGFSFLVTFGLTVAFPKSLTGWGQITEWAIRSTFGDHSPVNDPLLHGHMGHHGVYAVAGWLSTIALVFALVVLWRANRDIAFADAREELTIRGLLAKHGDSDSLGYFATRRDKSVVFSPDRRAAVTFRTVGSVNVASADPIGDRDAWPDAVAAWLDICRVHSLHAVVLAASEDGAQVYGSAGLRTLTIGDEAIIEVDEFSLRGKSMKPVRQAVNRISAAGYTSRIRRHGDLSAAELCEIGELAEQWRGEDTERGFSMALNRVGDPADGRCLLITALDADGRIRAFLSFVPWGRQGISLDLMRRDRAAENGVNEYLVAALIEAAPGIGVRRVSLNFAVFRSVFSDAERVGAGPVTRASDAVLGFASKFYQLKSLYRSNQKYQPQWVPRTLCYEPSLTVIRAAVAAGVAEGFLPHLGPKFLVGPKAPDIQPPRTGEDFALEVAEIDRQAHVPPTRATHLNEQQRTRHHKREQMIAAGGHPYPVHAVRSHDIAAVRAGHEGLGADELTDKSVSVTGRVRTIRDFGGLTFVTLEENRQRLQVISSAEGVERSAYNEFRRDIDLGDLIGVTGRVGTSKSGELSVFLRRWQMVGKCLNPLPSVNSVLADDVRARNRPLDLIVNRQAVTVLEQRARGIRALRECLHTRDFTEVDTPMLQTVHGGAAARPFTTHINAYDTRLSLRIAPELHLKRLCVAGMGRIFELNRNFRNEGADATHNPEFTSLEVYEAYSDYHGMADLARTLICDMATAIHGRPVARRVNASGDVELVDLDRPWASMTVHDAVSTACGSAITSDSCAAEVAAICAEHGVATSSEMSAGQMVMALYEAKVEKQTGFPTFYFDFPVEVSPLARSHRRDPRLTEHWDLVGFGMELGTAYSELTDPVQQRERLTRQSLAAAGGDAEAMQLDEEFLSALNYAMPPTGGLGLGVDRLVMMLTGGSIRSTLSFPFVRPREP